MLKEKDDLNYTTYKNAIEKISKEIIEEIGYGHTETVYQKSMEVGLRDLGFKVDRLVPMSIKFHDIEVSFCTIDILLNEKFIIEIKTERTIFKKFKEQLEKYLRQRDLTRGVIVNFNNNKYCLECKWFNKKWLKEGKELNKKKRKIIVIEEDEDDLFDIEEYLDDADNNDRSV